MNLNDVCEVFFHSSLVCQIIYPALWVALLLFVSYWIVSIGCIIFNVKEKRCPKCKSFMREQAFDHSSTQHGSHKHVHRDFFWVCRCGYSEKASESELIT